MGPSGDSLGVVRWILLGHSPGCSTATRHSSLPADTGGHGSAGERREQHMASIWVQRCMYCAAKASGRGLKAASSVALCSSIPAQHSSAAMTVAADVILTQLLGDWQSVHYSAAQQVVDWSAASQSACLQCTMSQTIMQHG